MALRPERDVAMPIRFRCEHCHQLMGIARRKAGTEVQCPTCRTSVLVPVEDQVPAAAASQPHAVLKSSEPAPIKPAPPMFERSEIDALLRVPEAAPRIGRSAQKKGDAVRAYSHDVEPLGPANSAASIPSSVLPPPGIYLSSNRATLLAVAGVILVALAFGAGLLVGRYCL
jgi:phage FluMu protein Com